jgi:hypothetical protein
MGPNQANLSDDGWEVIVDPLYIYMINMYLTMTLRISYECAYAYPYYTLNGISTITYHIHSDWNVYVQRLYIIWRSKGWPHAFFRRSTTISKENARSCLEAETQLKRWHSTMMGG